MRRTPKSNVRLIVALAAPIVLALVLLAGCGTSGNPLAPLPPLSSLTISPPTDTVRVGETIQFAVTALDTNGAPVNGTGLSWNSTDPTIFTVSGSGRVRGVGEGSALLIASASGLSDTAFVSVFPDTGWFQQTSDANGADLFGVFFMPDGRTGWAVGASGTIVHTDDAGATWERQSSNTGVVLNSVWFTSATQGWAVGANGTVMFTANGGGTWTRLDNAVVQSSELLKDVCFATADTGWVVGTNGTILRTFDGGASWNQQHPTAVTLESVSFSGTRDGWAVGGGGIILGTHDRGVSWYLVQPAVTVQPLLAVARRSATQAFAVGQQGVAPRTVATPDSLAWELRTAGAQFQLEGVYYPTDLIGYAAGSNGGQGAILRTDDAGVTWDAQTSRSNVPLNDVFFVDALRGWAVGDAGTIVHTARGGRQ
jgi:photosystem II stability/assembly factor-like uncharacterized protein